MTTRREFLQYSSATLAALSSGHFLASARAETTVARANTAQRFHFGSCVIGLEQAKKAGLEGVEVWAGNPGDRLSIADPARQATYHEQMKKTGLPICSLMMGLLNDCPLASDPRAPAWLEQAIDGAKAVGAKVILVAFFNKGDLLDREGRVKVEEAKVVVERLKAAAPRAQEAGLILGIENMLNGEQNMRLLDQIDHQAVRVYYDVYNTGVSRKHNVPADIRLLGERIVQFHFKNGSRYLDEDKAFFEPIAATVKDIGYRGWVVMETANPSKDGVADAQRNAAYLRKLLS